MHKQDVGEKIEALPAQNIFLEDRVPEITNELKDGKCNASLELANFRPNKKRRTSSKACRFGFGSNRLKICASTIR